MRKKLGTALFDPAFLQNALCDPTRYSNQHQMLLDFEAKQAMKFITQLPPSTPQYEFNECISFK